MRQLTFIAPAGWSGATCRALDRAETSRHPVEMVEGSGLFTCLGLFEGMSDGERAILQLDLLGRRVRVVLDRDLVMAA